MDHLHSAFWQAINDNLQPKRIMTKIIANKLRCQGITIDDALLDAIESCLDEENNGVYSFSINDNNINGLSVKDIRLDIDSQDTESFVRSLNVELKKHIPILIEESAASVFENLKIDAPDMLKNRFLGRKNFEDSLTGRWGSVCNLLEMLIVISFETGDDFNHEFRPECTTNNQYVFDVLTRLHARACQVAQEVLLLVRSGFADGAHARWRTLHEICVTALFVGKHGNDIAKRYLRHEIVESYHAVKKYQKYCTIRIVRSNPT